MEASGRGFEAKLRPAERKVLCRSTRRYERRWSFFVRKISIAVSSLVRGISLGHRGDEIEPVKPAARTRTRSVRLRSRRSEVCQCCTFPNTSRPSTLRNIPRKYITHFPESSSEKIFVLRCSFYKGVTSSFGRITLDTLGSPVDISVCSSVVWTDFLHKSFGSVVFSRPKNRRSLNGPVGLVSQTGIHYAFLGLPFKTIEILSCVWRNSVKCTFLRVLRQITALFKKKPKCKRHTRTLSRYKANYWILYGKQGTDWSYSGMRKVEGIVQDRIHPLSVSVTNHSGTSCKAYVYAAGLTRLLSCNFH